MKSKVISRTNRERLATILTVFACKDEFKPIMDKYNEACDLLTPVHNKILDDIDALPELAKRFVSVSVDDDMEVDMDKPVYDLRTVYNMVNPFYGDEERYGQMAFGAGDVIEVSSAKRFGFSVEISQFDWDKSLFPTDSHFNYAFDDMRTAYVKSNRTVSTGYRTTVPDEYLAELQPAIAAKAWATSMHCTLSDNMRSMARELTMNIESAKTTKNLVAAWPEAEPFIAKLYPECTDSGVQSTCETPLGNIILRHIKQLPAPAQAAQ